MTNHSIAELQRQYDQARAAERDASNMTREAFARLNAAKCAEMEAKLAARGIVQGVKVSVGASEGIFMGVEAGSYGRIDAKVAKIKKDGTAHATQFLWVARADDITLHPDAATPL